MCRGEVYQHPKYYDIAFSWRDVGAEVDVFEEVIQRYSHIPVASMLEIGCGPASHLPELACRGYSYVGLDLSHAMLVYARDRALSIQASAAFVEADMRDFHLAKPVDFAFVLLGSLYVRSKADLHSHFEAMSQALKPGGLYLLDWCITFATNAGRNETWTLAREGMIVTTTYRALTANAMEQTIEETLTLVVVDHGEHITLREVNVRYEIYAQEFLLFVAQRSEFEFVGWWNNWDLNQPLDGSQVLQRPIAVVRRH